MASDQTVLNIMGQALWDAKPTKTDLRAQQLAVALGYPLGWRVVRTIEEMEYREKTEIRTSKEETVDTTENGSTALTGNTGPDESSAEPEKTTEPASSQIKKEAGTEVDAADVTPTPTDNDATPAEENKTEEVTVVEDHVKVEQNESSNRIEGEPEASISQDGATRKNDSPTDESLPGKMTKVIVDRIYAGKPGTDCDMWYHHAAASQAALAWMEKEAIHEDPEQSGPAPTPFDFKGGHMLPRVARFDVGDKVEVFYEGEWWDAKIVRRKEHKVDGFRYQVYYASDNSKQSGVAESLIRPRTNEEDPHKTAASMGFDETWQAFCQGGNRWKIIGPDATVYKSKKAAMEAFNNKSVKPSKDNVMEEDPPWRTVGSEYLGKFVRWVTQHKASARRTVAVEQIGEVVGWISETDVDKAGEPGFVSEKTGKPSALYHVVFNDEPTHHPYASVLVEFVDLEEYELKECILSEEEYQPSKKARIR